MKKFIVGILMLALIGLLMTNVYAGQKHNAKYIYVAPQEQAVKYVPVNKYIGQETTIKTTTWTWTNECPYHKAPVVVCAQPTPVLFCTAPREPRCLRCLRKVITCPFRLVEKILFD